MTPGLPVLGKGERSEDRTWSRDNRRKSPRPKVSRYAYHAHTRRLGLPHHVGRPRTADESNHDVRLPLKHVSIARRPGSLSEPSPVGFAYPTDVALNRLCLGPIVGDVVSTGSAASYHFCDWGAGVEAVKCRPNIRSVRKVATAANQHFHRRTPMYLLIVPHGNEHRMQVDQRNMVLDLSTVVGSLIDPTITKVEWSQVLDGKTIRDGGIICRGASRQQFYDRGSLSPYIVAFEAEWLRRHQDQADLNARAEHAVLTATEAEAAAYRA